MDWFLHSRQIEKRTKKKFDDFFPHLVFWNTHNFFFITDFLFEPIYLSRNTVLSHSKYVDVSVCLYMCLNVKFVCADSKTVVATVCVRVCSGSLACFLSLSLNRALVCARVFSFTHSLVMFLVSFQPFTVYMLVDVNRKYEHV